AFRDFRKVGTTDLNPKVHFFASDPFVPRKSRHSGSQNRLMQSSLVPTPSAPLRAGSSKIAKGGAASVVVVQKWASPSCKMRKDGARSGVAGAGRKHAKVGPPRQGAKVTV